MMNIRTTLAKLLLTFDISFAPGETGASIENAKDHFALVLEELDVVDATVVLDVLLDETGHARAWYRCGYGYAAASAPSRTLSSAITIEKVCRCIAPCSVLTRRETDRGDALNPTRKFQAIRI